MTNIDWLIFATTLIAFIFLIIGVKKTKGEGQNIWTWFLWPILDFILFITTILFYQENKKKETGDLVLIGTCIIGSVLVFVFLLIWGKNARKKFGENEIIISVFTFVSVILWLSFSNMWGVIFSIIAQFAVGLLLMKQTISNPEPRWTLPSYVFFVIAYILTTFKTSVWSIDIQLFPITMGTCTIIEIYFLVKESLRRIKISSKQ
jgi:hypothetical protein